MARSFNQVILMGNLTRDPELRSTPNGQSVCSFSLALNRSYKAADGNWQEVTDYVDCVAWGPLGERVSQYLQKGRPCLVNGRLQSRSWEQEGQKRSKVEVVCSDVTFLGTPGGERSEGGQGGGSNYQPRTKASDSQDDSGDAPKPAKKAAPVIEEIGDEPINLDDIPF